EETGRFRAARARGHGACGYREDRRRPGADGPNASFLCAARALGNASRRAVACQLCRRIRAGQRGGHRTAGRQARGRAAMKSLPSRRAMDALDALVREAAREPDPPVDWEELEQRLFAEIDETPAALVVAEPVKPMQAPPPRGR